MKIWVAEYGNIYEGVYGSDYFTTEAKAKAWVELEEKRWRGGLSQMYFTTEEVEVK